MLGGVLKSAGNILGNAVEQRKLRNRILAEIKEDERKTDAAYDERMRKNNINVVFDDGEGVVLQGPQKDIYKEFKKMKKNKGKFISNKKGANEMAMVDRRFRQQINTGPTQGEEDRQGMFGRALSGFTGALNMMAAKRRAKKSGAVAAAEAEEQRADDFMNREGEFADARTMAKTIDVSDPNQVMAFQQAYNDAGGNLKIDGQFGPNTLAALRDTQGVGQGVNTRTQVMDTIVEDDPVVEPAPVTVEDSPIVNNNVSNNRFGSRAEVASRDVEPVPFTTSLSRLFGIDENAKFGQGDRRSRRNR